MGFGLALGCNCCGCTLCGKCIASFSLLDCIPLTFAWPLANPGDTCGPFGATSPNTTMQTHTGCIHNFRYCNETSTTTNYTYTEECTAKPCVAGSAIETYSGYRRTHSVDVTIVEMVNVYLYVEQYSATNQVLFKAKIERAKYVSYVDTKTEIPLTISCSSGPGGSRVLTVSEGDPVTTVTSSGDIPGTPFFMFSCPGSPHVRPFNQCTQEFSLFQTLNCETVCSVKTLTRFSDVSEGSISLNLPRSGTTVLGGCIYSHTAPAAISIPRPTCCGTTLQVQLDCVS